MLLIIRNGSLLNLLYLKSKMVAGFAFIQFARFSTPSSILLEVGAPGGCCPAACLLGKLFITTIVCGESMTPGSASIESYAKSCAAK